MWVLKKPIIRNEKHPLFYIMYCFIGMEDGWMKYDRLDYGICVEILKRTGYIEWQQ